MVITLVLVFHILYSSFITPPAPGDSPQEFNYTPGANSIVFTWKPPTQPNGLITQYTLTVITVQRIQTVVLDGSTLSHLICNILPLQQVRASISAATQVGEGPVVNIIAMTAAHGEYNVSLSLVVIYKLTLLCFLQCFLELNN